MLRLLSLRVIALSIALLPAVAVAEPTVLKLAFFGSDRSALYQAGIKPFVHAVNAAARDWVRIDVYFSSQLGSVIDEPRLVLDGTADIAFMIPGYSPDVFADNEVMELPGLFRNAAEATWTYTRLTDAKAFRSYEPFVVLGTYASEPQSVHSRKPIGGIASLKGLKVRANNVAEAAALEKLGATSLLLPINKASDAITRGTVDAAMAPPAMLFEFGIGRVTNSHFIVRGSAALMLLAMNRQSFERLPPEAQDVIRRFSGAWTAQRYIDTIEAINASVVEQLVYDPKRSTVFPTATDSAVARRAFDSVAESWVGTNPDKVSQLRLLRSELAKVRTQQTEGSNADTR